MKRVRRCLGVTVAGTACGNWTTVLSGVCGRCGGPSTAAAVPGAAAAAPGTDPLVAPPDMVAAAEVLLRSQYRAAGLVAEERSRYADTDTGGFDAYNEFHADVHDEAVELLGLFGENPPADLADPRAEAAGIAAEHLRLSIDLYEAAERSDDFAASHALEAFWGETRERAFDLLDELAAAPYDAPPGVWDAVANSSNVGSRLGAALSPSCPIPALQALACDPNESVRAAAVTNPACPPPARAAAGLLAG